MYGRVVAITAVPLGDEVSVAASIGATTLFVDDVADFNETGGELRFKGAIYEYASADDDTGSLVGLNPGLLAAASVGDSVDVWDSQAKEGRGAVAVDYEADLEMDDGATGDPPQASVDHKLAPLLSAVIRKKGSETVELEQNGDDLKVVNVLGKEAEIVGTTITGSVVQTSEPPTARVELAQNPDFPFGAAGGINMYTGDDGSWDPAMLYNQELTPAGLPGWYMVTLTAARVKALTPDAPEVRLLQGPDGSHQIQIMSETVSVVPPNNSPGGTVSGLGVTGDMNASGELHGGTVWVDSVPTTAGAANVNMGALGQLQKSTSSKRYKKSIRDADLDLDAVLAMRPRSWVSRNRDDGPDRYVGFIAEEVDALGLSELVVRDKDGRPDGFAYPTLVTHLLALTQRQQAQIDGLISRVTDLEAKES